MFIADCVAACIYIAVRWCVCMCCFALVCVDVRCVAACVHVVV